MTDDREAFGGASVRPVVLVCQRCAREVPAAELKPGKSVCRDCWDAVVGDLRVGMRRDR